MEGEAKLLASDGRAQRARVWKNRLILYAVCLVISFLLLMTCSANSFLYKFNDWCDLNWYITVGRGMDAGKVMYRDLFDQKGPLLYLLFSVFCLFKNPYLATWFFEVISYSFYLYFIFRLASRLLNNTYSLLATILVGFLTAGTIFFNAGGGAVEEYFLPIIAYVFLMFYDYYMGVKERGEHRLGAAKSIVIGLFLGIIFWVKYTVLVIPAVLLICWLVINLVKRQYKDTVFSLLYMVLGFAISCLPVVIYFGVTHAFDELWNCYFYINLFKYNDNLSFLGLILNYSKAHIWPFLLIALAVAGLVVLFVYLFKRHRLVAMFSLPVLVQLLVTLNMWRVYNYYFLVLMPYLVFAFMAAFRPLCKGERGVKFSALLCGLGLLVCFGLSFATSNNVKDLGRSREDFVQFQVARKIEEFDLESPTLLCYKAMDYGFYNALGAVPQVKYFAKNNFTESMFPEMYQSFEDSVKNRLADFVVTTIDYFEADKTLLLENYDYVETYSYLLYQNALWKENTVVVLLIKKVG